MSDFGGKAKLVDARSKRRSLPATSLATGLGKATLIESRLQKPRYYEANAHLGRLIDWQSGWFSRHGLHNPPTLLHCRYSCHRKRRISKSGAANELEFLDVRYRLLDLADAVPARGCEPVRLRSQFLCPRAGRSGNRRTSLGFCGVGVLRQLHTVLFKERFRLSLAVLRGAPLHHPPQRVFAWLRTRRPDAGVFGS